MSTEYDLYCVDCSDGAGLNNVMSESSALQILANMQRFAAGADAIELLEGDIRFNVSCSYMPQYFPRWCEKHLNHKVLVRDEYGGFSGRCYSFINCPHCGEMQRCNLPRDHDGPHQVKAK